MHKAHVYPDHAVRAITIVDGLGYLLLCLRFGDVAGPSAYSIVSEAIFDLANDLIHDPIWDPFTLTSPNSSYLHPPIASNTAILFQSVKPLLVHEPLSLAFCDGYIDDLIAMAVYVDDSVARSQHALPLSSHCIFRPIYMADNPNRNDNLSLRKLSGKGRPKEHKTVLAWTICTRTFTVCLAEDKHSRWIIEINNLLEPNTKHKAKIIESTIGRFNHVG